MAQWYKTLIRYPQLDRENNRYKPVSELFLHYAETFADVEHQVAKLHSERLKAYKVKGINEFKVADVVLHHLFDDQDGTADPDEWFLCKVDYSDFKEIILISAENVVNAHHRLTVHLSKSLIPFTIKNVDSTKILAVYNFENEALQQDYKARIDFLEPQFQRAEKQEKKPKNSDQLEVEFGTNVNDDAEKSVDELLDELRIDTMLEEENQQGQDEGHNEGQGDNEEDTDDNDNAVES